MLRRRIFRDETLEQKSQVVSADYGFDIFAENFRKGLSKICGFSEENIKLNNLKNFLKTMMYQTTSDSMRNISLQIPSPSQQELLGKQFGRILKDAIKKEKTVNFR